MEPFEGFPDGKMRFTPLPGLFFSELLPQIDHLGELKVTLYALWRAERSEGRFFFLRRADFAEDTLFMHGMGASAEAAESALDDALDRAVRRGVLLKAIAPGMSEREDYYFLNSPKGRAAVEAIHKEVWRPSDQPDLATMLSLERPNIFTLYEENIGPLTPMIADMLRDAEKTYSERWIVEAIRIAVEANKRSWRYIEAILRRWQGEGKDEQNRGDSQKNRRRYIEGEFSEFIEH
jgi:DNA replication protein